jgi:hypothetical protein
MTGIGILLSALVGAMVTVLLVQDLRLFPFVTLAGNSGEKESGGEQVEGFHLRRV